MTTLREFTADFLDSSVPTVEAHTSGSTGQPKRILLSKADMRRSARASNARFGITASSRLVCPLSLDYIAGKMMAVRAMEASCLLDMIEPANVLRLDDSYLARPATLMAVVPSQAASLLEDGSIGSKVEQLLIGGAPAQPEICGLLAERGIRVHLSYGMTETCSHVALADGADARRVFRAMPGITFSTDADGRLIINAPEFTFDGLTVNDLVELEDDTSFRWLGRSDNIINSGGIKLIPEQVEAEYARLLPSSLAFYVTAEPDKKWGQALVLVVENADCEDIRQRLRASGINHRHLPKKVVSVPRIARTASGKIIRR